MPLEDSTPSLVRATMGFLVSATLLVIIMTGLAAV
jgi:hypothetical protein